MSGQSALAGGGLSLLSGYLGSKRARKEKHSAAKRLRLALQKTEAIQGRGLAQQEALTRKATGEQLAGYDTARKEASRLGRTSRQSALDRERQLGASLSQGLTSRGLGSTTVGGNLQRGIASDTTRELSSINEGLAGLFGDLAIGRGGVQAGGTQALAGLAGQRADLMSSLGQMGVLGGQTLGNFQSPLSKGAGMFESSLPGIGSALGGYMAGKDQQAFLKQLQALFSQG